MFYLDIVIETFRECLNNRYDKDFDDVAKEYFAESGLLLIGASRKSEFESIKAIAKYDLLSGVATAYSWASSLRICDPGTPAGIRNCLA